MESPKFIYIFSALERDAMLGAGFELLQSNDEDEVYIFLNKGGADLGLDEVRYAMTDTLTL